MIAGHAVTHFTGRAGGPVVDYPTQSVWDVAMTAPFNSRHIRRMSPWSAPTSTRSYYIAALRAAAISLVLLAGLAFLVLF